MEPKIYLSPYRRYSIIVDLNGKRERLQFEKCRYCPSSIEEEQALLATGRFEVDFCLEEDYPTFFGGKNDRNPKLLDMTLKKISKAKKEGDKKNEQLTDENAKLKAELEALKKGDKPPKTEKKTSKKSN